MIGKCFIAARAARRKEASQDSRWLFQETLYLYRDLGRHFTRKAHT
jgi:hypothetical protein